MPIKANKETRRLIYNLCTGVRREADICDYLLRNHKDFSDKTITEKTVRYHLSKLKDEGLIHFKYDGRIIDLER